jgi:hypothetical protein
LCNSGAYKISAGVYCILKFEARNSDFFFGGSKTLMGMKIFLGYWQ